MRWLVRRGALKPARDVALVCACARAWCRRSIKAAWSRAAPVTGWSAAAAGAQRADLRYKLEDGFLADLVNVKESTYFFCIIFPSYNFFLQRYYNTYTSLNYISSRCIVHIYNNIYERSSHVSSFPSCLAQGCSDFT